MAAQVAQPSALQTTYKVREAEGILDVYFYRRVGFQLARLFAKTRISPIGVTLLGGLVGITASHLYFYRDLRTNIVGMLLHVCANALDNADGQLARLTGRQSREGRIIDSLVDHLIFISIYVNLTLRALFAGASPAVFVLAIIAGVAHGVQGGAADYFRNAYLYFVSGGSRGDFDSSAAIRANYQVITWRDDPWNKLLLALYLNFTRQQELASSALTRFRETVVQFYHGQIPSWLSQRYREAAQPTFRYWSGLMTNTRMLFLFVFLIIDRPTWFFWTEITLLNFLLIYLLNRQATMCRSLLKVITEAPSAVVE
jgi:hypothetical protein